VPDGTEKPEDDTVGYTPTAFPGARAPHVWLGQERSILDLFGDRFVLLKFASVPSLPLEEAAQERGVPLQVHRIESAAARPIYRNELVLVRPDGHVAWRGDGVPDNALALIDTIRGAGLNAAAQRFPI
jgi:hypothetical protein